MKAMLRALLRFGRRLLGTEQILQAQRQQLEYQRQMFGELRQQLLRANSLLKYSLVDPEVEIKSCSFCLNFSKTSRLGSFCFSKS